jgi:hypothetical protein
VSTGRCAFGIDTDMQNDVNNIYLQKSAEVFKIDGDQLPAVRLANLIPILARPMHGMLFGLAGVKHKLTNIIPALNQYVTEHPAIWMMRRVQDVVDLRTKSSSSEVKRVDLLQLMMDATTNDKITVSSMN